MEEVKKKRGRPRKTPEIPEEVKSIIEEVLNEKPSQIEQYRAGKTNMFDYFVGQVMKKTRGQANPSLVRDILSELLK